MTRAAAGAARSRGLRAALLARVVFALLVSASVGAFFYAQALKREAPLVLRAGGLVIFRPGGPGRSALPREAHFYVETSVDDVLDIAVTTMRNRQVGMAATGLPAHRYREIRALHWNGRTAGGAMAPPGSYLLAVRFRRLGQTVIVPDFQLRLIGASG